MRVMTMSQTADFDAPEAKPFLLEGSQTGLLWLHGFTSTPQSVRDVGEQVHDLTGATVYCPLLAGHGETPDALAATDHQDWVRSAETALEHLETRCSRVLIGGLSLGATLALNLAARLPDRISGLVTINGSTGLYRPEVVAPLYDTTSAEHVPGIGSDIARAGAREICYDVIPRSTLKDRFILTNATGALLPLLQQPILIMQSRTDHVVDPKNATRIACTVASNDVRLCWLTRSWHVATLDHDQDLIASHVADFVRSLGNHHDASADR